MIRRQIPNLTAWHSPLLEPRHTSPPRLSGNRIIIQHYDRRASPSIRTEGHFLCKSESPLLPAMQPQALNIMPRACDELPAESLSCVGGQQPG